ncbi:hypothetical protein CLCR_00337 [Cladophialophora carrionii]|uniref:Uncharacterized protein n=1 Tax=Cladophialophora carrionii TaxID=86049 RepID=A0A1C1D0F8_9EURO|nr:hypothetical protein CLCR_00337 [Cladophialophora carrionii]
MGDQESHAPSSLFSHAQTEDSFGHLSEHQDEDDELDQHFIHPQGAPPPQQGPPSFGMMGQMMMAQPQHQQQPVAGGSRFQGAIGTHNMAPHGGPVAGPSHFQGSMEDEWPEGGDGDEEGHFGHGQEHGPEEDLEYYDGAEHEAHGHFGDEFDDEEGRGAFSLRRK